MNQTVNNQWAAGFRIFNGVCGGLLAASGAITAYFNTLGTGSRWVSIVMGAVGVIQVVVADVLSQINNPGNTNPPAGTTL